MNRFKSISRPLQWFMALLLVAFVAGCGGGGSGSSGPISAKAITAFSLTWTAGTPGTATGTINETLKTIAVTVPFGTNVTAMTATFTKTGASVTVAGATQASGTSAHNFTGAVAYTVTAVDGTTATYNVTVTVASNTAKAFQTLTLAASGVASINTAISEGTTPKTIVVTMPFGTNLTVPFVATFTTSGANVVKVGGVSGVAQVSGPVGTGTSNIFPVTYTVIAANGSTALYNVSVIAALNSANAITSFTLAPASGVPASPQAVISGTVSPFGILVTMPNGTTDLTHLVATFAAPGASSVKILGVTQVSDSLAGNATQNDFSAASGVASLNPVAYVVTAADSSTAVYNVRVIVAAAPPLAPVYLGTAGNFAILTNTGIGDIPSSVITGNIGVSATTSGASIIVACSEMPGYQMFSWNGLPLGACQSTDTTASGIAAGDMGTAYTTAGGMATAGGGGIQACPGAGAFSDATDTLFPATGLPAGVYTCAIPVSIPGDLTLHGSATDVWVFNITGTLGQASATKVLLTGGALPQNVFWVVSDVVTIGASAGGITTQMQGVILAAKNIAVQTGATVIGRLLAQTRVDLDQNTITQP